MRRHKCDLNRYQQEEYSTRTPNATFLQRCKTSLEEYTTIHPSSFTAKYFRSHHSYNKEKMRHLKTKRYKFVIHPLSIFLRHKIVVVLFCWLSVFVVDPALGTFFGTIYLNPEMRRSALLDTYVTVVNGILTLDMISRFFTGYVVDKTGEIVLEPREIVRRYVKTYLLIDCLPLLGCCLTWVSQVFELHYQILVFLVVYVRLLRTATMIRYWKSFLKMLHVKSTLRSFVTILLMGFLTLHWWTCFIALIPICRDIYNRSSRKSWLRKMYNAREKQGIRYKDDIYNGVINYIEHLGVVVPHFFGAGTGKWKTNDDVEQLMFAIILMSGLVYTILILAQVLQIFGTVNISETKYEDHMVQLTNYLTRHEVPIKLKRRTFQYYNIKFNQTFFDEKIILMSLSEHLRMEVLLYSCRNLVERVQIFKGLSRAAVGAILALLEQHIYLPGDVIMSSDQECDIEKLYFVLYGTCAIETLEDQEAFHIEDGGHFGEVAILERGVRMYVVYKVVALEPVEIHILKAKDLDYCCNHYPEISNKLEAMAKARLEYCKRIMVATRERRSIHEEEILEELRTGRILRPGIRRDAFQFT